MADNINSYKKIHHLIKNNKNNILHDYLNEVQLEMIENFKGYKSGLDLINFKNIYEEVSLII